MASFEEILSAPVTEIKVPPPLPVGTYLAVVDGIPAFNKIGQNQTDCIDFQLKLLQPQANVSAEELAAYEGGVMGKALRHRLFVTEESKFILEQFLFSHLDISLGISIKEALAQANGRQVYVTVRHRPAQDGSRMYAEVGSTAKV